MLSYTRIPPGPPESPDPPQFAHNAPDAMRCYVDLVQSMRRAEPIAGWSDDPRLGLFRKREDFLEHARLIQHYPVYFWSAETATVVQRASTTYPLRGGPMYLPQIEMAFCVFQRPTLTCVIDGRDHPLSALAWTISQFVKYGGAYALQVIGYEWKGDLVFPCWWSDVGLNPDDVPMSFLNDDDAASFLGEQDRFVQWILTASMFLEQEILERAPTRVGKYVARHLPAPHESTCHVVGLRRIHRGTPTATEAHPVDWHWRWLVSGHWRRQYYRKADRHVPIYISPYLKGPEDRPLKPPSPRVYAVTR